jgi:hypothetical protein
MLPKKELERKVREHRFAEIVAASHQAGLVAVFEQYARQPMEIQTGWKNPFKRNYISGEICGFAWVIVQGNTAFGRWVKKDLLWEPCRPRGVGFFVTMFGQSFDRKSVYAEAFAVKLIEAGIPAHSVCLVD